MNSFQGGIKVVGRAALQAVHPFVWEPDLEVVLQGPGEANAIPANEIYKNKMITMGILLKVMLL